MMRPPKLNTVVPQEQAQNGQHFSSVKEQQIFRDSCGGDVFMKISETTAHRIGIGRFIGDAQEFQPSDHVETKLDASYS